MVKYAQCCQEFKLNKAKKSLIGDMEVTGDLNKNSFVVVTIKLDWKGMKTPREMRKWQQ